MTASGIDGLPCNGCVMPAGNPAAISKRGEKECVNFSAILYDVEYAIDAFVDKGYRAYLEAGHLGYRGRFGRL